MAKKKIDFLFVNPNSSHQSYQVLANKFNAIEPPTWAVLLATSLNSKGFKSEILDCDALRLSLNQSLEEIIAYNPRMVVMMLYGQNPNAGTSSMIQAIPLAELIKSQNADIKIVMGGSHSQALPRQVIAFPCVDFVLINEGVQSLFALGLSNLKDNLENIPSIFYKSDGKICHSNHASIVSSSDLDKELPGYDWSLLPDLNTYRAHYWHNFFSDEGRSPFTAIYTSLGCQFACSFCMINIINRTSFDDTAHAGHSSGMRYFSPELMLAEFDKLAKLGVKNIRLSDEMFFLNRKHYIPILEAIIQRKYDFNMWAYARVDSVREDQLALFRKAGVRWIALGIETANQNVRHEIERGKFKQVNVRDIVKLIESYDIHIVSNFIFGLPNDSLQTMRETLDLAKELNTAHANFYPAMPLPGSPLYMQALQSGWQPYEDLAKYSFLSYESLPLATEFCTPQEILTFRDNAWHEYFTNPIFLDKIGKSFGMKNRSNIEEMTKLKLRRKILENNA